MNASWDTYTHYSKQGPQLVYVDRSYHADARLRSYPILVHCVVWPLPVDKFKVPSPSAMELIMAIETKVQFSAESQKTGHYVGRLSFGDITDFNYYTADGLDMIKTFKTSAKLPNGLKRKCSQEADYQWSWYQKALYPRPLDLNKLENEKIRIVLRAHGDNGATRRQVMHTAHFPDSASLEAFATRVTEHGYKVERRSSAPDNSGKWSIVFSQEQAPVVMDIWTWGLRAIVAEHEGEYDGWESPVIPRKNN